MQVDFYHLTQAPLDRVLPRICERVLAGGGRLLVVSESDDQRARLDRLLWTYDAESFLPHGQAGEAAGEQPVLISGEIEPVNEARNVALADGVWRDEALSFDRAFHFFDEDRIGDARAAWKGLAERHGVTRNYWKQDENGRWQKAA